jgi:hypothetical protein
VGFFIGGTEDCPGASPVVALCRFQKRHRSTRDPQRSTANPLDRPLRPVPLPQCPDPGFLCRSPRRRGPIQAIEPCVTLRTIDAVEVRVDVVAGLTSAVAAHENAALRGRSGSCASRSN